MAHPYVDELTAQIRAIADSLAGSSYYNFPTQPQATAVLMCFVSKLRGEQPAGDVPLQELVTSNALTYFQDILDEAELRDELVGALRNFQVVAPTVRPQADGRLGILLAWIHPDQDEVLYIDTPRLVEARMAYLSPTDNGEWRLGSH